MKSVFLNIRHPSGGWLITKGSLDSENLNYVVGMCRSTPARKMTWCRVFSWQRRSSTSTFCSPLPPSFLWTSGCSTPKHIQSGSFPVWMSPSASKTNLQMSLQTSKSDRGGRGEEGTENIHIKSSQIVSLKSNSEPVFWVELLHPLPQTSLNIGSCNISLRLFSFFLCESNASNLRCLRLDLACKFLFIYFYFTNIGVSVCSVRTMIGVLVVVVVVVVEVVGPPQHSLYWQLPYGPMLRFF